MNNSKVYVKIGRKYRDAFKSICDLVNHGCIDRSIVQSCRDDRWIETDQYIFEYTGDVAAIDTGAQVGMTPSGASWFMGFRGGESDSVMGTWHNLIELVSTNYHKEYSLVEFLQSSMLRDPEEAKACKQLILNLTGGLKIPASKIEPAAQDESMEDIYVVSLRMELFSGAGEPRPLLCKISFRKRNNTFSPLSSSEAAAVDEFVSEIVSKRSAAASNAGDLSETEIVDNVLNSVAKLIAGELSGDFAESILVTNPTDIETLHDLVENEPRDEVQLECKKLKVLGISHIQWIDTAFNVYVEDRKAFLAKIGLNDAISLYCCCGGEKNKLIESNVITCTSPETGETVKIVLDTAREDLGLTSEQLEKIQRESAFADHYFPITCSELMRRRIDCTRYRCKCNTFAFEVDGKTRYKCTDCPYPEVVYRYPDGTAAYTPLLGFDTKTLSVVQEETETCRYCGRSYKTEELTKDFLCEFCSSALTVCEKGSATAAEKKTYGRYAGMLPLSVRVRSVFGKKYCFENSDRLLFVVGKNKYFFDKLKLTDGGLIEKPEKRK